MRVLLVSMYVGTHNASHVCWLRRWPVRRRTCNAGSLLYKMDPAWPPPRHSPEPILLITPVQSRYCTVPDITYEALLPYCFRIKTAYDQVGPVCYMARSFINMFDQIINSLTLMGTNLPYSPSSKLFYIYFDIKGR